MNKVIQQAVQALYDRDGDVTASSVVREAKKKSSPLHDRFTWDDTKAAMLYRLREARKLIRTVRVEYDGEESRLIHVPSIQKSGEGHYKPIRQVVEVVSDYERSLAELLSQLSAIQRAVEELEEMAGTNELDHITVIMKSLTTAESAMRMMH